MEGIIGDRLSWNLQRQINNIEEHKNGCEKTRLRFFTVHFCVRRKKLKESYLISKHNLEIQGNRENEKVKIALAHIDFTIALIYAKINNIMEYKDFDRFKEGIKYISEGIKNKTNEDYFYGLLKRNNKKVNDVIEFYKYVVTNNLDIYNLTAIERKNVDEFVTFMFKAQNNEN
ncbi:hypothetical protein [Coprococcus sp. RTP21428st1_C9_RTP21428_210409]|uniref:hypothetical protein n=2 Tax=Coprococcus TaxID=33042 RepID=UPI002EAE72FB|nr:hypothetical protein [Coprococcus sp.]